MALTFNGTTIPSNGTIKYNNTNLTKVIYNGVTVWAKMQYLYNSGNLYTSVTGGYEAKAARHNKTNAEAKTPSFTKNSTNMQIESKQYEGGTLFTVNKIDLTGYSTLTIKYDSVRTIQGEDALASSCYLTSSKSNGYTYTKGISLHSFGATNYGNNKTATVNIASVSGSYYIGFYVYGGMIRVKSVYLS